MDSPLPPDPYAALGVPKDADAATIKSTYRKLALKCHPDKVTDESLKKQKQDEFHKIQSAYELIGDEDKRATYDAQLRLAELRKEKLERTGGIPSRSASYDYRAPASSPAFSTPRYEERKPTRPYDDDKYFDDRSSSRKYDGYEAYSKRPPPRSSRSGREPIRPSKTSDKAKSDHKKTKDREERRDRSAKFSYAEEDDSPDEKARYEREYKKRSEEARLREKQEAEDQRARKEAAEARRKADEERRNIEEAAARSARRSTSRDREDRFADERQRKLSDMENHVKNYISTSRNTESRPQASRTSSSRDARDYYDIRPRRSEAPRRSSARPRDRESAQPVSSGRDGHRKGSFFPEIVEWDDDSNRSPPSFKHSMSSPAEIKTVPRATPQRAHTESSNSRREPSPSPVFRRSETMPSVHSSTRRKESTPTRSSTLRNENVLPTESRHSSPETAAYPSIPSPQPSGTTKKYYYATPGGGVTLAPEDFGLPGGHRTILREPETRRRRSPSPLTRTVPGPTPSRYSSAAAPPRVVPVRIPPPPLGRSATMSTSPERRPSLDGRGPSLFGELESDYLRRERAKNQTSFAHDQINWAKKYGPESVEYSRGREKERDYPKPALRRNETYVY